MDAEVLQRIAVAVAMPATRKERAPTAADLMRDGTGHRRVGIYTVTDSSVVDEAWSGLAAPAFPTFSRERGLTAHALRVRAPALTTMSPTTLATSRTRTTQARS